MKGIFTISLDLKLHWGCFDKHDREARIVRYQNTLTLIPQLLSLFKEYEVHVTWAAVGSILAKDQNQWELLKPAIEPVYEDEKYSAYKWVQQNGLPAKYECAHFAPQIIEKILQYPGQELATHTFIHYNCLKQQQEPKAFSEDLVAAINAGLLFPSNTTSLVFPRNKFNSTCLKTCFENGINIVRSNRLRNLGPPRKILGSLLVYNFLHKLDTYFQIGSRRSSYPLKDIIMNLGEPLQLPASRFLRPWQSNNKIGNKLRLRRICQEIEIAARKNECYHLWWHPENFGDYPAENIMNLRLILEEYKKCKIKYDMQSWNMADYANYLLKQQNVQYPFSLIKLVG